MFDAAIADRTAGGVESKFMTDEEIDELTRRLEQDPATWDDPGVSMFDPSMPVELMAVASSAVTLSGSPPAIDSSVMLRSRARLVAHHQAMLFDTIAELVEDYERLRVNDHALVFEGVVAEVQAALTVTRRHAEWLVGLACELSDDLPDVASALRDGTIDMARVRVLADETVHLDSDLRRTILGQVLPRAPGLTTGQLRALIRRLCIDSDPESAAERRDRAHEERMVSAELTEDHTATVVASGLEADRVAVVMDRINRIAHTLCSPDEPRSIDQLRADVFIDLLEGRRDTTIRGGLDVRVDLTTLAGLDDRAAELGGFGPVIADIARQLTDRFGPSWRIGVTDDSRTLVHTGITRRRPDAATRRDVEMRDQTCVFPGCRMPASRTDLDHRIPHADGGDTHPGQLVALCRHHHVVRHRHGWTHTPNSDGSHTWHSPLGNTYIRPPPDW